LPEHRLRNTDSLGQLFNAGRLTRDFEFDELSVAKYREVIRIPFAAHTSVEALRWIVRSSPRPDGLSYRAAMRRRLEIPALQIQGGLDAFVRSENAFADSSALFSNFTGATITDGGHYLPEEHPEQISNLLLAWLGSSVDPSRTPL
jgi:pimeloyl-ACP methyl ester carboxylesterase